MNMKLLPNFAITKQCGNKHACSGVLMHLERDARGINLEVELLDRGVCTFSILWAIAKLFSNDLLIFILVSSQILPQHKTSWEN